MGVGWIADGVFGTGTEIELTRVWSALAAYEHIWNPKWRTAIGGGYVERRLQRRGQQPDQRALAGGRFAACGVPASPGSPGAFAAVTPAAGNSCSPDYSFWEAYTRTQWNPVPQLDIGIEVLYTRHNTAFKGPRP